MDQQTCVLSSTLFGVGLARPKTKGAIFVSNRRARQLAAITGLRICPAVHGTGSREPIRVSDRKARGLTTRRRRGKRGQRTRGRARQRGLQPRASDSARTVTSHMREARRITCLLSAKKLAGSLSPRVPTITRATRGVRKAVRYLNGLDLLASSPLGVQARSVARMVDSGASLRGVMMAAGVPQNRAVFEGRTYLRFWRNLHRRRLVAGGLVAGVERRLYEKLVAEDNHRRMKAMCEAYGLPCPPGPLP